MIVYVVLNSKFKEHLLQVFRDIANFISCNKCKKDSVYNESREDATELFTRKTFTESYPVQNSPIQMHDITDNRSPVFV